MRTIRVKLDDARAKLARQMGHHITLAMIATATGLHVSTLTRLRDPQNQGNATISTVAALCNYFGVTDVRDMLELESVVAKPKKRKAKHR